MRAFGFVTLAILVSGCSTYEPPLAGYRSDKYKADLAACQASGDQEAHHQVMSRFPLFLAYPVSLPLEQRHRITDCMHGKGYS
jgi:hypothetical protein